MNYNKICVFDTETTAASPLKAQIWQIGAVMVHPSTLKVIDEFKAEMKPADMDSIEDQALQVGRTTREYLNSLPETSVVWPTFVNWVEGHNKKKNVYTAPIPAGYNILGYDMPIIRTYCKKYKTAWDEERQDQKLFSQVYKFDVLDHLWYWFESNKELEKLKIEYILRYMGADESIVEGSHDALVDSKNTADILIRLFKMQRFMTELKPDGTRRLEMKNCMAKKK